MTTESATLALETVGVVSFVIDKEAAKVVKPALPMIGLQLIWKPKTPLVAGFVEGIE
jgi:hypothetical protein